MENEELDEIDYYEIVSLEEITKYNPTFVVFSNDEIYNNLLEFFKSDKVKGQTFLRLFNEIIERQKNKIQTNNFIIIADAKRGNFTEKVLSEDEEIEQQEEIKSTFMISEFVNKIKNSNKDQVKLGFKNKNKIWFPLVYDDESAKIKYRPTSTSIIELGENDNYVIFKDDERDIPIMGLYFHEPKAQDNDNLNEKIVSYLNTYQEKGEVKLSSEYKSFDELIGNYKTKLPLDKIDEDEYNYLNLSNLLKKFNYDLDYISIKDFELIKNHLKSLASKEKTENIKYSTVKNKPIKLDNNRILYFSILKKTFSLIDITLKSAKKIQKDLDELKDQKVFIEPLPIHNDLSILISNINNDNYSDIINNLRDIRKNLSINNCSNILENCLNINIEEVKRHFEKLENKFKLIMDAYKDLYEIRFSFEKEEKDIKLANDMTEYEGLLPNKIDYETKKEKDIYEDDDDDYYVTYDEIDKTHDFDKYYNNYYYKTEEGFNDALKIVLPFIAEIQDKCHLPIKMDLICQHLFNRHRGIQQKYMIIKEKYNDKYDNNYCKELALQSIENVMMSDDIDDKLKEANMDYMKIINEMIYDVICKWSLEVQRELLEETLINPKELYYVNCINLWNDYGAPYNMDAKDGILHYIVCVFKDVYKEVFSDENGFNYLPLESNIIAKIITRINENYKDDLGKLVKEGEIKKTKENKGYEAQKKLAKFLEQKNYDKDKFFETFIQSLLYFPSVKYKKIHKYLLGCCLEKIDNDFSNDKFFKTDRKDLLKAKSKFSSDRVLNKKRNLRFYLVKQESLEKKKDFIGIKYESLKYPIYEISLEQWFNELDETTILNKSNINDIRKKLTDTYKFHKNILLPLFIKSKSKESYDDVNEFKNYRQILIGISTTLYSHLKEKAITLINKINNTIQILDKLSSIINDDNEIDIATIRTIIVIRAMCLPSFPDNKQPPNLKSHVSIDIKKELYNNIFADIKEKILKIINNARMPTKEERDAYINNMREANKNELLSKYKNKTIDEKNDIKKLKKIGLAKDDKKKSDSDDDNVEINEEMNDDDKDRQAEYEHRIDREEGYDDIEDSLDINNFGFIYAD